MSDKSTVEQLAKQLYAEGGEKFGTWNDCVDRARQMLQPGNRWALMAGYPTNILDATGKRVARCDFDGDMDSAEAKANAELIVRAANSHDKLLAAARAVSEWWELAVINEHADSNSVLGEKVEQLRAAIAEAE